MYKMAGQMAPGTPLLLSTVGGRRTHPACACVGGRLRLGATHGDERDHGARAQRPPGSALPPHDDATERRGVHYILCACTAFHHGVLYVNTTVKTPTPMTGYSALMYTRPHPGRVPGVPGSAKRRLLNRGCDVN